MTPLTDNEVVAGRQAELQRAMAAKVATHAEYVEAVEQDGLLAERESTTKNQHVILTRDVAVAAIPHLISGRGRRPDVSKLIEIEREISLIVSARVWLKSRLPGLRVAALKAEGYSAICEADLEEVVARIEQKSSAEALAKLKDTLGPKAQLTIDGASFQERLRRAGELVERGSTLLREAADLERKLQAA